MYYIFNHIEGVHKSVFSEQYKEQPQSVGVDESPKFRNPNKKTNITLTTSKTFFD